MKIVWNKCEGLEKRVKSCEHVAVSQTAGIDSFLSKTLSKGLRDMFVGLEK